MLFWLKLNVRYFLINLVRKPIRFIEKTAVYMVTIIGS